MKVPRKLDVLIKFYKQTISNERISHRTRMSAAIRLDEIYGRFALLHEKAAARKERYEARATAQREPGGANAAQETAPEESELSEDARLDAVFGPILNRKGKDSDGTD